MKYMKKYWYKYRLRGFSLGCQPKDFVEVDHEHGKWGAVAYNRPLTDKEISDHELNDMNRKPNRLKELAKDLVSIQDKLSKENLFEWDKDELGKEADRIRDKVLAEGHSVDSFVQYMREYKNVSFDGYREWINS